MFPDKSVSSMQPIGDHGNLLTTKTITRRLTCKLQRLPASRSVQLFHIIPAKTRELYSLQLGVQFSKINI